MDKYEKYRCKHKWVGSVTYKKCFNCDSIAIFDSRNKIEYYSYPVEIDAPREEWEELIRHKKYIKQEVVQ